MSDIVHEHCGIALIRLLKPLSYYKLKYGSYYYGINKLYLLMEKQHNRGQDGAGVACLKFDMMPGTPFLHRLRSVSSNALEEIFGKINSRIEEVINKKSKKAEDITWLKNNIAFLGELLLGHVRYGTYGKYGLENVHPFRRNNNWLTRNLVLAGNFNLTNVDELFKKLLELGQHPKDKTDTITILEKIGHFLDIENERLFKIYKEGKYSNAEISTLIAEHLDIQDILINASKRWDGGYTIAGFLGHGDAFVLRDPNAIRPAYYYHDDEIVVATSERPPIQTAFNVPVENIKQLKAGHALIIKRNGTLSEQEIHKPGKILSCSFERIYFSRGNDKDIYRERKKLGAILAKPVLKTIDYDFDNSVFSFIPNTAEVAFLGMMEEIEKYLNTIKENEIGKLIASKSSTSHLKKLLSVHPRIEKIALKDTKLRTFITNDLNRDDKTAHVYDTTYGVIQPKDTLIILDDSIVRGTTLKQSILKILDKLGPKKIIIVSSAPQIQISRLLWY